jgi:hypothetical protein
MGPCKELVFNCRWSDSQSQATTKVKLIEVLIQNGSNQLLFIFALNPEALFSDLCFVARQVENYLDVDGLTWQKHFSVLIIKSLIAF